MVTSLAFTTIDRKVALIRAGRTHSQIAEELKVDRSLVSHVIGGRRNAGADAVRVMEYVAKVIGAPVETVFPGFKQPAESTR